MPGIRLTLAGDPDRQLDRRLVAAIMDLTESILGKAPARTMVMIQRVDPADWYIAGRTLAELDRRSFRLELTVTDETCTKKQKAAFAVAAYRTIAALIGDVHPHSNIHIIDCRAAAYSYGGVTQDRHAFMQDAPAP